MGVAITPDAKEPILERSAPSGDSSRRRDVGTDLGVTVSKQLVALLGGEMGVVSETVRGSNLWFELPFPTLAGNGEKQVASQTLADSRVLVVSGDHSESRRVMRLLSGWGVYAEQREGTAQAIAEIVNAADQGRAYNTVVVDTRGSRSDPLQLLHTIKHDGLLQDLAFVLVSPPLPDADWKQRMLDSGFSAVLVTPFDKTLLFNALHSVYVSTVEDPRVANFIDHYARDRKVLQPLEILVAEDDEANQKVVRSILEKAGHRIFMVENGDQALDALDAHRFDIALFDLQMPAMDGLQALKVYRFTHTDEQTIPVIVLSADATTGARRECMEAGAAEVVTKPIRARGLLESLSRVMSKDSEFQEDAWETGADQRSGVPLPRSSTDVIDRQVLRDLEDLGGDLEFVAGLAEGFVKDADLLLNQLADSIAEGARRQFRDLANALKGSAGSVGARRLHELSGRACRLGDQDFSRLAPIIETEMRLTLDETKVALERYISERRKQVSRS
jgi:two-component system sensor histidine kinase RpfC